MTISVSSASASSTRPRSESSVDEALAELTEIVTRDPEHAGALYQRGLLLYTEKGALVAALEDLERALALEPDDALVRMIHQELVLERGSRPETNA